MVDKLTEECTENVDEVEIAKMALLECRNEYLCSNTICVVLAVTALATSIGIGAYFTYKCMTQWYLEKDIICVTFGTRTQTTI